MKYWRGYLVAAIFAAITRALMQFAQTHAALVDMIYPYVTRMIQGTLADWSAGVDFLLWQLLAMVLVIGLLASIVLMIVLRWNPIQWFGWVLATGCFLFFLHTGIYGLNYYAGPLAEDVRLEVASDYTTSELADAATYFRDQANALAKQMDRDSAGDLEFPSFAQMAEQAADGYEALTFDDAISVFAGSAAPVKELGWSDMYTSMGISGFTMPLTGEAAVNPQLPVMSIPFTMCHEMAHRMCIASEGDANFAAFLACNANSSPEFRYSAYFMAFRYCYNTLASSSMSAAKAAAASIRAGINDQLQRDLNAYSTFLQDNLDDSATQLATSVNDKYLTTSGDDAGVASYGEVTDLLVSWYIQEIVLPQHVEVEEKFDPLDEAQVDLSGIVGALG